MVNGTATALRRELNELAFAWAHKHNLVHALSDGELSSVIFGRDEAGRHGNFHPASYRRICANVDWVLRLNKAHTASRRMMLRSDWRWRELDCAVSSDALLMNIFCHPHVLRNAGLLAALGVSKAAAPIFGFKPRVPLRAGKTDQTEIDMKLGDLLVEAKLTESNFQRMTGAKLSRYRDLAEVFFLDEYHQLAELSQVRGYQVIRGILAAHASGGSFCLLCDARRPDLIEIWYSILCLVRNADLRCRIKLMTWQEVHAYLPGSLQGFLSQKYGNSGWTAG